MILLFAYPLLLALCSSVYLTVAIRMARGRSLGKAIFFGFAAVLSALFCTLVFYTPDPRMPIQEFIPALTVNFGIACAIHFRKLRLWPLIWLATAALVVLVSTLWCIDAYPPDHASTKTMAPSPDGHHVAFVLQCEENSHHYSSIAISVKNSNGSLSAAQEVARGSDPSYELGWTGSRTLRVREFALDHSSASTLTRLRSNWHGIRIDLERHSPGQAMNESTPLP